MNYSPVGLLQPVKNYVKPIVYPLAYPIYSYLKYRKYGDMAKYMRLWRRIPGWTAEGEGVALTQACSALPPNAVVLEIGSFLGKSTVLLAGARKLQGSGKVHCIDPFDASGETFSVPLYQEILGQQKFSQRQRFDENIQRGELSSWIEVYQGKAQTIAPTWTTPIDLLFLDGDQSPEGARFAYEHFVPFLKSGGIIALHNSNDRDYAEGHDGHRRLALETVRAPEYTDIYCVDSTTFARKV